MVDPFLLCIYIYIYAIIHQGPWVFLPRDVCPSFHGCFIRVPLKYQIITAGDPHHEKKPGLTFIQDIPPFLSWWQSLTLTGFLTNDKNTMPDRSFLTNWSIGKLNWPKRGTDRHRRDACLRIWSNSCLHAGFKLIIYIVHSSWCPNHLVDLKYKLDWPD